MRTRPQDGSNRYTTLATAQARAPSLKRVDRRAVDRMAAATGAPKVAPRAATLPIVIDGGSLSGLSTALSLAQAGHRVVVLEARANPREPHAKDAKLWGTRERTIVFDHLAMERLASLGADTSKFPRMRYMQLLATKHQPVGMSVNYKGGIAKAGKGTLDAPTLMSARDASHQPLIAEVENALLDAVLKSPNITIKFGAAVTGCRETATDVVLQCADGSEVHGSIAVVADGGGSQSLIHALGVKRVTEFAEVVRSATFDVDSKSTVIGHPASQAGCTGAITEDGWYGFNSNGSGNVTVNVRSRAGTTPRDPVAIAHEYGLDAPLKAPASQFEAPIERTDRLTVGKRTFIIADAAVRGTSFFGFGGQFALLWSQVIADMCARGLDKAGAPTATARAWFDKEANAIADRRIAYEKSWSALLDASRAGTARISNALRSPDLVKSLGAITMEFDGKRMTMDVAFDLGAAGKTPADAASILGTLAKGRLYGTVPTKLIDGRVELYPTHREPLRFENATESVVINGGQCKMIPNDDGTVRVTWDGVTLERTARTAGAVSQMLVDHLDVKLPRAIGDRLLAARPQLLTAAAASTPTSMTVELRDGLIDVGPMRCRLHDRPIVDIEVAPDASGDTAIDLTFRRGYVTLENASEANDAIRPHNTLQALGRVATSIPIWGRLVYRPLIDTVVASRPVRHERFVLHRDGSASADIEGLSANVDAATVANLLEQMNGLGVKGSLATLQDITRSFKIRR